MSLKRRVDVTIPKYPTSEDEESNNEPSDADSEPFMSARSSGRGSNTSGKETRGCRSTRAGSTAKRPCLNRNALLARENRRRKKEYMEKIENKLSYYKRENENLSNTIRRQGIDLKRLQGEVSYLKNVINNSSSITNLLRSMNKTLAVGRRRVDDEQKRLESSASFADDESVTSPRDWTNARQERARRDKSSRASEKERLSLTESDHTYTTSNGVDGSVFVANGDQDLFLAEDTLGLDIVDDQLDRLPRFDEKLFDSVEDAFDRDTTSLSDLGIDGMDASTKLFDDLDNSGVCLHVNSGRISLEFCSICHLNSVNAVE